MVCGGNVGVYETLADGAFFKKLAKTTLKDLVGRAPESRVALIEHLSAGSHYKPSLLRKFEF